MLQLDGRIEMILALVQSYAEILGFEDAYDFEDLDDKGMFRVYPENIPAANYKVFLTSLYYRLQDPLYQGLRCNLTIPAPENDVFRITAPVSKADKMAEDFFVYNNIESFAEIVYPLSLDGSLAKIELIAIGLTEDDIAKLNKQGKTAVVAGKVHKRIEKVGDAMHTTGRIVTNDVINPLATASAKTAATVVSGLGKTAVDCGLAAANELLRDAAQFSLSELKQRKDVKTMMYSVGKIMNKTKQAAANKNNGSNNFNF